MNAKNLVITPIAFTVWQIMVTNVLSQGDHLNDVSSFRVYLHWMFVTRKQINLLVLILNHMFRCRNQGRSDSPYVRMLTTISVNKYRSLNHYCGDIVIRLVNITPIEPWLA